MGDGGGNVGGLPNGEQTYRVTRADAAYVGEQVKEAQVVGGGEAVEGHLVLAHHELGVHEDLGAHGAQRAEGPRGSEYTVADAPRRDDGVVGAGRLEDAAERRDHLAFSGGAADASASSAAS